MLDPLASFEAAPTEPIAADADLDLGTVGCKSLKNFVTLGWRI
jgi:hypothetical protein